MADKYKILYGNIIGHGGGPSNKGLLISTPEDGNVWLKDAQGKTLNAGSVPTQMMKSFRSGNITNLGMFKVLLERVIREKPRESLKEKPVGEEMVATKRAPEKQEVREFDKKPTLDAKVLDMMHKHQIEASKFVLARLLGEEGSSPALSAGVENALKGNANPYASSDVAITGCILADEMGLGKSLTALCVVWSLIRHGRGKGVIVCPSSLVGNWQREIGKWLPGLDSKTLYVKSSQKDKQVYDFITGPSATTPLLVISYENFRSVADKLNKLRTWDTIVCDEGHRLKNAELTQTSLALGNCVAQRRLVLTGTPLQNNLDELYSVVNFVCPGYLGTLEEFATNFREPITNDTAEASSAATMQLKTLLRRILIRRVRDDVLSQMLPPKECHIVYCSLSEGQKVCYKQQANALLNSLLKVEPASKTSATVKSVSSEVEHEEGEGEEEDDEFIGTKRKRRTPKEVRLSETQVLPALMELRLTSVAGSKRSKENREDKDGTTGDEAAAMEEGKVNVAVERSGKICVLDTLLKSIRTLSCGSEKAVVVSNFQHVLKEVEELAKARSWHFLRIDGEVAADRRMKLVNHFNAPKSPFFLMLLSAKAGGVGLNLVGGSRLVMLDPDWNPATDQQAMGRIWRDGQKKPVHIYRLISAGSIEETILDRQRAKGALSAVIGEGPADGGEGEGQRSEAPAPLRDKPQKMSGQDLRSMVYPQGESFFSSGSSPACSGGEGEDAVLRELRKEPLVLEIKKG